VHQGIINGKVNFVVGGGIKGNEELVRMFDPILKYISADIEISNSAYVKVIFDPAGKELSIEGCQQSAYFDLVPNPSKSNEF
jgi:hypothetical protein